MRSGTAVAELYSKAAAGGGRVRDGRRGPRPQDALERRMVGRFANIRPTGHERESSRR
jgi:hypothetical protein